MYASAERLPIWASRSVRFICVLVACALTSRWLFSTGPVYVLRGEPLRAMSPGTCNCSWILGLNQPWPASRGQSFISSDNILRIAHSAFFWALHLEKQFSTPHWLPALFVLNSLLCSQIRYVLAPASAQNRLCTYTTVQLSFVLYWRRHTVVNEFCA